MSAMDDFAREPAENGESASVVNLHEHRGGSMDDLYAMRGGETPHEPSPYGVPHDAPKDNSAWASSASQEYTPRDFESQGAAQNGHEVGGPRVAPAAAAAQPSKMERIKKAAILLIPALAIVGFSGYNIYKKMVPQEIPQNTMPTFGAQSFKQPTQEMLPPSGVTPPPSGPVAIVPAPGAEPLPPGFATNPAPPAVASQPSLAAIPVPADQGLPQPAVAAPTPSPAAATDANKPTGAIKVSDQHPTPLPTAMANGSVEQRLAKIEVQNNMLVDRINLMMDKITAIDRMTSSIAAASHKFQATAPTPKPVAEKKPEPKVAAVENKSETKPITVAPAPAPQQKPVKAATVVEAAKSSGEPAVAKNLTTSAVQALKIYAMKDGVAWIADPNGQRTMVAIGDQIPGRGSVKQIDVEKGEVRMSDGSTIR